jgi:transposase
MDKNDRGKKKKLREEKKERKLEKARQIYINTYVYMHTYCIYKEGREKEGNLTAVNIFYHISSDVWAPQRE